MTGDLTKLKKTVFTIKEGVQYRVRIDFLVQREIVHGLKYGMLPLTLATISRLRAGNVIFFSELCRINKYQKRYVGQRLHLQQRIF